MRAAIPMFLTGLVFFCVPAGAGLSEVYETDVTSCLSHLACTMGFGGIDSQARQPAGVLCHPKSGMIFVMQSPGGRGITFYHGGRIKDLTEEGCLKDRSAGQLRSASQDKRAVDQFALGALDELLENPEDERWKMLNQTARDVNDGGAVRDAQAFDDAISGFQYCSKAPELKKLMNRFYESNKDIKSLVIKRQSEERNERQAPGRIESGH